MKAIVYTRYGSPDVLRLETVEKPTPKDNEVLIKVRATSINPFDDHALRAQPFFIRFDNGLRRPKNTILGADVAGEVEAVGKDVTRFQPGDAVFGDLSIHGSGGLAEYVAVPEASLVHKPDNISYEEGAAVVMAGFTALQALRDKVKVQRGHTVLINGASGGVGTYTVQIAKELGAEVTGVCSTRNLELVRSLGAIHVIDYTQEDFSRTGQHYHAIIDNVGNRSVFALRRALKPGGVCAIVGFVSMARSLPTMLLGAVMSIGSRKKVGPMLAMPNQDDLKYLQELLAAGKLKSVIDKTYPLDQTAEAFRYLETGRARGKIIITVEH